MLAIHHPAVLPNNNIILSIFEINNNISIMEINNNIFPVIEINNEIILIVEVNTIKLTTALKGQIINTTQW